MVLLGLGIELWGKFRLEEQDRQERVEYFFSAKQPKAKINRGFSGYPEPWAGIQAEGPNARQLLVICGGGRLR